MKQKIVIEIEAEYGSDFQVEMWFGSLVVLLQALRRNMLLAHKKNKMITTLNGNPIQDIPV